MPTNNYHIKEIKDFIGKAPNWILKSGITVIMLVILILLSISHFISYPDKITTLGRISTFKPPVAIYNINSSIIDSILVGQKDSVKKHQNIIYFQNEADIVQMDLLLQYIKTVDSFTSLHQFCDVEIIDFHRIGPLYKTYLDYKYILHTLQLIINEDDYKKQLKNIEDEISNNRSLFELLIFKEESIKKQMEIADSIYYRNEYLLKEDVISQQDYEQEKINYIVERRQLYNIKSELIRTKIRINNLQYSSNELISKRNKLINEKISELNTLTNELYSEIAIWQKGNYITAQASGIIYYDKNLKSGQHVPNDKLIGYIEPFNPGLKEVILNVSSDAIGKININDKINIKVNAFPHKDYGILEATVNSISKYKYTRNDEDSYYEIRSELSDSLISSYGKNINYIPNMDVVGEVITEDRSIITRVFGHLLDLFVNT